MLYFLRCVIASAPPLFVCFPAVSFLRAAEQQLRKGVQQCQQCLQLSQREQGVDRHHVGEFKEEY